MRRAPILLALTLPLAACAATHKRPVMVSVEPPPVETGWRKIATRDDQDRVQALSAKLASARAAVPRRLAGKLAEEGALVDPAAAQTLPEMPPGPYHCRLLRFRGRAGFASFAPDFCYVQPATDAVSFTKQTGSNLPQGYLYPDSDKRLVFLGTFRAGADGKSLGYNEDQSQDVAGVVERVSSFRWRLILTRAGKGAALDLYELVPVTPAVPGAKPAVPAS